MRYSVGFKKIVYGCLIFEAKDIKEAKKKFEEGDINDEFDNKSEYTYNEDGKGETKFEEMAN